MPFLLFSGSVINKQVPVINRMKQKTLNDEKERILNNLFVSIHVTVASLNL